MRRYGLALVLAICVGPAAAVAQTSRYIPLGTWQRSQTAQLNRWRQALRIATDYHDAVSDPRRPMLPGLRPIEVELLEDALLRKHGKSLSGSRAKAREAIRRRYLAGPGGRAQLRGYLAEALFLKKNPEWQYVQKPNATQHDVYKQIPGRKTPFNAQIKTFKGSSASKYAAEMRKDWRAHRFIVPDDHVAPIKAFWRAEADRLTRAGNPAEAKSAWRNYARVRGLGVTSAELDAKVHRLARPLLREQIAGYVSFGAAAAVGIVPPVWEWSQGRLTNDQLATHVARGGSVLGAVGGTNYLLRRFADGALRGTVRGNIIVGMVIVTVDTGWQLYQYGGTRTFQRPEFWEGLGGSLSATAVGFAVGLPVGTWATALAAPTGPFAPVIGGTAGLVAGGAAGTAGYIGGSSATRWIIALVAPEMLQEQERQALSRVRGELNERLDQLMLVQVP